MSSVSFSYLLPLPPPLITALRKASFFLFPNQEKYIHRMFSVGKKKHTLNSNVGFISCSLTAFLLKRSPRNAACFLRKFTVWHNRLSGTIIIKTPRDIGLTLSLMFPARTKIQLTISTRLPSVCYVPPNIRTNYRHLTVFTLKKGYARNVCDFFRRWIFHIFLCYHLRDVFISFWFVKTELSATFSARAHKDITVREIYKKNAQDIFCLLLYF